MDASHQLILLGAALVLLSILAGLFSARLGAPLLLVFLGLGMLAGEDGPGGIHFQDFQAAYLIGSVALAVILFEGGLRTHWEQFRRAGPPALVLATIGVGITAGIVCLAAMLLFRIDWKQGLLIGSIVASTDAAAVFGLLRLSKLELHARVRATLEVESGVNDPMAIFLTIVLVQLLTAKAGGPAGGASDLAHGLVAHPAAQFAIQMVGGAALGYGGGRLLIWLINRVEIAMGLYPIMALAGGLLVFALAQTVGASGFLAIYLVGVVVGNRYNRASATIDRFLDAFAWLSQIVMFLMLGLLVTPTKLLPVLVPSLILAGVLMLVARPVATFLCLLPFRFSLKETTFVSWVGLRGAVPIFLATVPVLAGAPGGERYFAIAFVIVLASLVVQGWTISPIAKALKLSLPPAPPPPTRFEFDLPGLAGDGDTAVAGYRVSDQAACLGKPANMLRLPDGARLLAVLREGRPALDGLDTPLQADDTVLIAAKADHVGAIDRLFAAKPHARRVDPDALLGDFSLEAETSLGAVAGMYGVPVTDGDRSLPLADYLARELRNLPTVGDRLPFGPIELIVQETDGDRVLKVGIGLEPERVPAGVERWAAFVAALNRPWLALAARFTRRQ